MSALQLLNDPSVTTVLAGSGLIDTATEKLNDIGALAKVFTSVAAVIFVIYQAIQSRGAMARVVVAGFAAAVFMWLVWNVEALQGRVDNEINASASSSQLTGEPAIATGSISQRPPSL